MQEYLKNIVTRLQGYSKDLDVIEVFVDKKWIYIDDQGRYHQYTFLRDKRLLMSLNGITKMGSWELLSTKQLLINRLEDKILLDKFFIEKALLVMKLSGSDDEPFVLMNKDEIPDLDALAYLERYEHAKSNVLDNVRGTYFLTSIGRLSGSHFYVGLVIKFNDGIIPNGSYRTTRDDLHQYVVLINNIVKRIYYLVQYKCGGEQIVIEQVEPFGPQARDKVLLNSGLTIPANGQLRVTSDDNVSFNLTCNQEGVIFKVSTAWGASEIIFFVAVFVVIQIFIEIISLING